MAHAFRFLIFIAVSCAFHLLVLQLDFDRRATPQTVQRQGVSYVIRSAENFLGRNLRPALAQSTAEAPSPEEKNVEKNEKSPRQVQKQIVSQAAVAKESAPQQNTLARKEIEIPATAESEEVAPIIVKKLNPKTIPPQLVSLAAPIVEKVKPVSSGNAAPSAGDQAVLPSSTIELAEAEGAESFAEAKPRYKLNPLPEYSDSARRRGLQGTVQLEVLVLTNGRVGETKLASSSGYKNLDRAAQRAVKRWTFEPATSFGRPVRSRVVIPIDFVLENN